MRWTSFPRFYPHIHARDSGIRRFWRVHVPLSAAVIVFFELPAVERWVGEDASWFFTLVLLHLAAFAADVHLRLYERWPTAITTMRLSLGFAAALSIAIVPGKMLAPLFSLYGFYVLYLTRCAPASFYIAALVALGPFFAGLLWEASLGPAFTDELPELAVLAMAATGCYALLATFQEETQRLYAELETKRERIAAHWHDDMGKTLEEAALLQDLASRERGDEVDAGLEQARYRTGAALLELRMAVSAMTAGEIEAAHLSALLRSRVESLCEGTTARARVEIEAGPATLSGEAAHRLTHLVTEAVDNALRHGAPELVTVEIRFHPLAVRIHDDGRGFDSASVLSRGGLASIRASAAALGARFTVTSSPSTGTVIEVRYSRSALNPRAASRR